MNMTVKVLRQRMMTRDLWPEMNYRKRSWKLWRNVNQQQEKKVSDMILQPHKSRKAKRTKSERVNENYWTMTFACWMNILLPIFVHKSFKPCDYYRLLQEKCNFYWLWFVSFYYKYILKAPFEWNKLCVSNLKKNEMMYNHKSFYSLLLCKLWKGNY